MKKKLSCAIILVITIFSTIALTASADFSDIPEEPSMRAVLESAVNNGLLTGYDDGQIKPYNNIKRAEMAAIIVRAFGAKNVTDISGFADMNPSQWYYDAMSKSVAMGIFQGDGTNLNPENYITYQEAFTVLARVFDLQTDYDIELLKYRLKLTDTRPNNKYASISNYSDGDLVADWAKQTVTSITDGGYWNPADNMLRPTEPISRLQFAVLINNLVTTYIDEPGTYDSLPAGNVLIRSGGVTINTFDSSTSDIFVGDGVDSLITFGEGVNVDRLIIRAGNTIVDGTYNLVRVIGHNCITDLSKSPRVKIQALSKYDDSCFSFGKNGV